MVGMADPTDSWEQQIGPPAAANRSPLDGSESPGPVGYKSSGRYYIKRLGADGRWISAENPASLENMR